MKKIKAFFVRLAARPMAVCIIVAPLLNLFMESLARHSALSAISHMVSSPAVFIYNSLIVFLTLSVAMFFKRKYFVFYIILALWTVLAVVNCVVRFFRPTPVSAIDFFLLKAGGGFFASYLAWWHIALIVLGFFAIVFVCVLIWRKAPRPHLKKLSATALVLASLAAVGTATVLGMETEILSDDFNDLVYAYENYGFAYCFSRSMIDTGVDEPDGYSADSVQAVLSKFGDGRKDAPDVKPDIVIVQLESFFDPAFVRGLETSEDCVPNFRALTESYPSGLLFVQAIGGGTANTEFEVLTGMNLDHFGPGEYPFMTVLSGKTCEALPNLLRRLGYSSHAYHNYTGVFYDRNKVYANLGFDSFTPMEYMNGLEFNPNGYAKDKCLIPYITDALENTESPTFVFAVSLQCHGLYKDEKVECDYDIKVSGVPEKSVNKTEYYVDQLKEVDDFIGALIAELEKREKPTILLLYGDHLPPLDIDGSDLDGITTYQTEYVIWSNYELRGDDRDLEAYQLSAHLFGLIGYDCGTITKINLAGEANENYQDDLRLIEYDMLYGKNYSSGGIAAEPTGMKMGRYDVKAESLSYDDRTLYVRGENFTEYSRVKINGHKKRTVFIDENTLAVENVRLREGDAVSVAQIASESGALLGESNDIKY